MGAVRLMVAICKIMPRGGTVTLLTMRPWLLHLPIQIPITCASSFLHLCVGGIASSGGRRMSDSYCTIEFDGASKGNPGKGGAGAVIRNSRGDVVSRTNKPLSYTTNNVAEYEALILGLEEAHKMGYKDVRARGDSKLVCNQVGGSWKVRSSNLYGPNKRVNDLVSGLDNFKISYVPREYNTEADGEANKAVYN